MGGLLRRVLAGELALERARTIYAELATTHHQGFAIFNLLQQVLPRLPVPMISGLAALIARPQLLDPLLAWHGRLYALDRAPEATPLPA